jgi:uncharacterized cupredoxin-like copper-binding protein
MTTTETRHAPSEPAPEVIAPQPGEPAQSRSGTISVQALALVGVFLAAAAFLAAMFAVGLAARALEENDALQASGGAAVAAAPTIVLSEFELTPSTLSVPPGTTTLTVSNEGAVAHNLSIDGHTTATIDGGETTTLDISDLSPGEHTMLCAVPGHEAAGMTGTITIT